MSTTQHDLKQTYNPLSGVIDLYQGHNGARVTTILGVSVLTHILCIALVALVLGILQFFGFSIPLFQPLSVKPRDIEFVLVENPEAPPRDRNTKNRAEKATRSGGEKIPNRAQAEPQRAAGAPAPAQKPQPAAKQSQPRQQPQQQPRQQVAQQPARQPAPRAQQPTPQPAPMPKPEPQRTPSPPAPKMTAPTKVASNMPVLPPSPRPTVRTPMPSNPSAVSGPIYKTPSGGTSGGGSASGSASSGTPGPSSIPGSLSRASAGSPGTSGGGGGGGGHGSMNQSGSPGGGGGRAGVDALPEPDFGPYIAELQRRIKRNWNPPQADRSKRVVAFFTVGRDGRLLNVSLQQSSGTAIADEAAVAAIRASAPFRSLPPEFRGNSIDVQFIFDYDVFSGGGKGALR